MQKITILAVGQIKEKYVQKGIEEYIKRLTPYCKLKIIEVKDEPVPKHDTKTNVDLVTQKEAERLFCKINFNQSYIIALDQSGEQKTSLKFADNLNKLAVYGKSDITFVIGGSLGLADSVIGKADLILSFSKLTFPHQLIRLFLVEQLYRANKINSGEPYHK